MLAINLLYLYLLGRLTLRPRRVVIGGAANSATTPPAPSTTSTTCFLRLLLCEVTRKAFLLPIWDNCIAF